MKYDKKEIISIILNYLKETSAALQDKQEIPLNIQLVEAGIIDSIGVFNLILFIEEKFKISIDCEEVYLDDFRTIEKISDLVHKKLLFYKKM